MSAIRLGGLIAAASVALVLGACSSVPHPHWMGPLVRPPADCGDFTIPIYFDAASFAITEEAGDLIASSAKRAHRCETTSVTVVGLADSPGDPAANLKLSQDRAAAVTQALAKRGFASVSIDSSAVGSAGSETAGGQNRPLRRRADVTFHLAPKHK